MGFDVLLDLLTFYFWRKKFFFNLRETNNHRINSESWENKSVLFPAVKTRVTFNIQHDFRLFIRHETAEKKKAEECLV